jgi:hypothetical protein
VEPNPDAHGNFIIESVLEGSVAALTQRVHEGDIVEAVDGVAVKGCTSQQLKEWVASEIRRGVVTLSLRKGARGGAGGVTPWKAGDVLLVELVTAGADPEAAAFPSPPERDNPPARARGGAGRQEGEQRLQTQVVKGHDLSHLKGHDLCQLPDTACKHTHTHTHTHTHNPFEKQLEEVQSELRRAKEAHRHLERVCADKDSARKQDAERLAKLQHLCSERENAMRVMLEERVRDQVVLGV